MLAHWKTTLRQVHRLNAASFGTVSGQTLPAASKVDCLLQYLKQSKAESPVEVAKAYSFLNQTDLLFQDLNLHSNVGGRLSVELPQSGGLQAPLMPLISSIVYKDPVVYITPIMDPLKANVLEDAENNQDNTMHCHKSDLFWRKRSMKRHRLLRWRKKHYQIFNHRVKLKLRRRRKMKEAFLTEAYTEHGCTSTPPRISEEEAAAYIKEWRESGRLVDILSREEIMKYSKLQRTMYHTDYEMMMKKRNAKKAGKKKW